MTKLYFIGGASGSGKTAIRAELQTLLGKDIKIHDFDDIGVPDAADKKWRQESTEKWLQKLTNDDKDACLLGQIVLGEILACPSATNIDRINFCLLDISDFERIQRLKKRNTYGADQNMLNWSVWLRMHHQNPQWAQHVIKDDAWDGLDFSIWDQESVWPEKITTKMIDTTMLSIKEVAKKVSEWINDTRISFKIIEHGSKAYKEAVALREQILRKPFGLCFTEEELLEEKDHIQVIGVINDSIVATAVLVPEDADCKMQRVVIKEDLVNKGIGSKMMEFCEGYAKQHGFKTIYCHARDTAVNFYLKNQYIAEGDYFEEDTIPHLKMRKEL